MRPLSLSLTNFQSYRGSHEIDLSGVSLAVLSGPNGAGKSSLIQAIRFALFGASRAGLDSVVTEGEQLCRVEFGFALNGDTYLVSRQRSRKGGGKTTTSFQRTTDGTITVLDGKGEAETQKRIESVLCLTDDLFLATSCAAQGDADRFSCASPANRKATLVEILQLGQWERRAEAARSMGRDLSAQTEALGRQVDSLTAQATEADSVYAEMVRVAAEDKVLSGRLEELSRVLDALTAEREDLVRTQAEDAGRRRELTELAARLEALRPELEAARARLLELEAVVATKPAIEAGLAAAQAGGQQAERMEATRLERERLTSELATLKAQYDAAVAQHQAAANALAGQVRQAQDAERARVEGVRQNLVAVQRERGEAQREKERQAQELRRSIEHAKHIHASAISTKMDVAAALRKQTSVLANVPCVDARQDPRPATLSEQCPLLSQAREARERLPQIEAEIEALREQSPWAADEQALSALLKTPEDPSYQERADALTAALAPPDPLPWAQQEAQLKALADTTPGVDLAAKGRELRERRDAMRYDAAAHEQAKATAAGLPECQRRLAEIEAAEGQLEAARQTDTLRQQEALSLTVRTGELEIALGPARDFAAELEALTARQQTLSEEAQQSRVQLEDLHRQHGQLAARHEAATAAGEQAATLEAERAELARRVVVLGLLGNPRDGAYSKGGIPALLIEQAIPALEAAANDVLSTLSDGRMAIELRTQREGSGKGLTETLDLVVSTHAGPRMYESYSGGEQMRVNLAIRAGLAELLAARAGSRVDFLVLDEPAAPLDDAGRQAFCECMAALSTRFPCCLVISHCPDIIEAFPTNLRVSKDTGGSRVEVLTR